jgi:hypothetical protein
MFILGDLAEHGTAAPKWDAVGPDPRSILLCAAHDNGAGGRR